MSGERLCVCGHGFHLGCCPRFADPVSDDFCDCTHFRPAPAPAPVACPCDFAPCMHDPVPAAGEAAPVTDDATMMRLARFFAGAEGPQQSVTRWLLDRAEAAKEQGRREGEAAERARVVALAEELASAADSSGVGKLMARHLLQFADVVRRSGDDGDHTPPAPDTDGRSDSDGE